MDIKEIGACAVVVIGGVTYAISSGGLKDALTEDIRPVVSVKYEARAEYMDGIVAAFSQSFDAYIVQIEAYDYVGHSKFSASPSNAMFVEVVSSDDPVPSEVMGGLNKVLETDFCAQEEMTMFTDKGWNYNFTLQDNTGHRIFTTVCRGKSPSKDRQAVS